MQLEGGGRLEVSKIVFVAKKGDESTDEEDLLVTREVFKRGAGTDRLLFAVLLVS